MDCICFCYYSLSSLERKSRYLLFYLICFYVFSRTPAGGIDVFSSEEFFKF